MEKTAYFKHALTGKVGKYPENYATIFPDVFERVGAQDYNCVDCGPKDVPNVQSDFGVDDESGDQIESPSYQADALDPLYTDDENEAE